MADGVSGVISESVAEIPAGAHEIDVHETASTPGIYQTINTMDKSHNEQTLFSFHVPSAWYSKTHTEPSDDALAKINPISCDAQATPFTDAECTANAL